MNAARLCTVIACGIAVASLGGSTIAYDMSWHKVASGGGISSNGTYTIRGLIGAADAAPFQGTTGQGFTFTGGFWTVPAVPCVEDLDGGGSVDFADLLLLLGAWGPCPGCPEDLNGNGDVDFADMLIMLGAWGPC